MSRTLLVFFIVGLLGSGALFTWSLFKRSPAVALDRRMDTPVDPTAGGMDRPFEAGESPPRLVEVKSDPDLSIAVNPQEEVPPAEDLKEFEKETDPNRRNWRILRYSLHEYRKKEIKEPVGSREGVLMCRSVATMLQLTGRDSDPDMSASAPEGEHYMISNGRGFRWKRGEFPEYDAWKDYAFAKARFDEARERDPKFIGEAPVYDSLNFSLIEARAVEAIQALEAKYGFH